MTEITPDTLTATLETETGKTMLNDTTLETVTATTGNLPNEAVYEMPSNAEVDERIAREMADPENGRPIPPDKYRLYLARVVEHGSGMVDVFPFVHAYRRFLKTSFDLNDKKDAARFAQLRDAAGLSADAPNADLQWKPVVGTVKCIAGRTRNVITAYKPDTANISVNADLRERMQDLLLRSQRLPDYKPTLEDMATQLEVYFLLNGENAPYDF